MSNYTRLTNWKLFIGASVTDPPAAPGSDTFTRVMRLISVVPGPNSQPAAEFFVLDSTDAESLGGQLAPRDWPVKIYDDAAMTPHTTLEADSLIAGGRKRNFRVEKPNGKRIDFVGFVNQWTPEGAEASGDASPPHSVSINVRQTGVATVSDVP